MKATLVSGTLGEKKNMGFYLSPLVSGAYLYEWVTNTEH